MDNGRRSFEAHALKRRAITQIFWFQVVSLFVEVIGEFEILPCLGVLALVVRGLGLIGYSGQNCNHNQQHYRRRLQTSHSQVLVFQIFAGQSLPDSQSIPRAAREPRIHSIEKKCAFAGIIASRFSHSHLIAPVGVTLFSLSPNGMVLSSASATDLRRATPTPEREARSPQPC